MFKTKIDVNGMIMGINMGWYGYLEIVKVNYRKLHKIHPH